MRKYTKAFRVADVGTTDLGEGRYHHVLIAGDGETWQVARSRDLSDAEVWQIGQTIEMSMTVVEGHGDRLAVPVWRAVGAIGPMKYELLQPYESVAEVWGQEIAGKFLTPTEPKEDR